MTLNLVHNILHQKLKSTTKILGTPGSDSAKMVDKVFNFGDNT